MKSSIFCQIIQNISQPYDLRLLEEVSTILYDHQCYYMLKNAGWITAASLKCKCYLDINKKDLHQIFCQEAAVFGKFKNEIRYAILKGVPLSCQAYGDPHLRKSGDIDILVAPASQRKAIEILYSHGFVQGKVRRGRIVPYSREEILFHMLYTHQLAPFIKRKEHSADFICIDLNTDILWGQNAEKIDISSYLQETISYKVWDNTCVNILDAERQFLQLCLHAYKDMNDLTMLYIKNGFKLSLLCDIFYYIKNVYLDTKKLQLLIDYYKIEKYVNYVLYYCFSIFCPKWLIKLDIRDSDFYQSFGLRNERYTWKQDLLQMVLDGSVTWYLDEYMSPEVKNSIKTNLKYMF